ncbi:MAG: amidohydrolase family protein [Verrucomicrobia bacterium]|nr:amidohydrolase family protein [Verrucomicrobiota bacterium]MBU1735984.1 amidohydrolase family protein [Verrucomicrobiota bacterium]MBU1857598.1 amidohydrolase family protein [Verrucomicrobiota bacterium]
MFIDCHLHTRLKDGLPRLDNGDNYATPEELVAMMDRTGVDKGVLLPGINPECHKQYSPTEDILDVAVKYPDRFIPFCNIDPRAESNSPDANLSRQLCYYKKRGCKGVGELCANLHFDDPLVLNLFKHSEACAMPVLFHVGPQAGGCYGLIDDINLPRLEKCLRLFPKLVFIGHSQPFWAEISADVTEKNRNTYPPGKIAAGGAIPRLLDDYPNLQCDISAGSGYNALTRDAEFGYRFMEKYQDRLLFGTDICSPKNDHRHAEFLRNSLKAGKIRQETFEKIAWKNINRILKLGL